VKKQTNFSIKAQILRSPFILLLTLAVCAIPFSLAQRKGGNKTAMGENEHQNASSVATPVVRRNRALTFADRAAYQRAIEEVYWHHRIWPATNPSPKPSFDKVMSQAQIEKKVEDYLRDSRTLENYRQRPITSGELQAEMERIASHTKQPRVLRELFDALGNDPFVIAECVARPVLTERLVTELNNEDRVNLARIAWREQPSQPWIAKTETQVQVTMAAVSANYTLPAISSPSVNCTDDMWTQTSITGAPTPRIEHTAVWTGSEMIVWGGFDGASYLNTGGRYNPSTDSWITTSITSAPAGRYYHTAVWTGSQMIVWGGFSGTSYLNTGGRYDPSTNSWVATSTANAPAARAFHTAVWAGGQMIVWGGEDPTYLNTGGRYNPGTDSWTNTSTTGAPAARELHAAVWTGSQMIVWAGYNGSYPNTGGRYNPSTDSWATTSTINAPSGREVHNTEVWTGNQMIVWVGYNGNPLNTGGRYNPSNDSWTATSTTGAPAARNLHEAVWTSNEMIVWGGTPDGTSFFNTGGRYDPSADSWTPTSTVLSPAARGRHTEAWTGSQMIVWGGADNSIIFNTGGRYCAASPSQQGSLGNISTRSLVQTGEHVMIGGFIVQGTGPKQVIIRAIGPELTQYGIADALANPRLELHNGSGALIATNDDWQSTILGGIITSNQVSDIQNSGHAPTAASESAIIANLQPGNYTAIVNGVNNTTGVALVEVYDLSPGASSSLGNISTRSFVQTGEHVMIGGFIIQGSGPKRVIIRAIGPELTQFGIPDALSNPTLELHDGTGALIATNDDWQTTILGGIITSNQVSDIQNSGHAPSAASESAIIANLQPGNYTAIVNGVNNTTGVALVEVYDLH
jgi:N-acetylneuraminic acid mutarotase